MYVTQQLIDAMVARYGEPVHREFTVPVTARELWRIRNSQRRGRNHDVTLYVRHGNEWIVIAKNVYPPELYRAPSGGLEPGEDFETGISREVAEELGCQIALKKFLLITRVAFVYDPNSIDMGLYDSARSEDEAHIVAQLEEQVRTTPPETGDTVYWRSFVFLADYAGGEFHFTDTREIREVRSVPWEAFAEYGKVMRARGVGGLLYRALLHEEIAKLLGKS